MSQGDVVDTVTTGTFLGGAMAFVAAIVAAIGTYLVARRRSSGQIATSDAATLWAEAEAMRKELRTEVLALRAEILGMSQEIRDLKIEIRELRARLKTLGEANGS